jgi:ArsR family metal-binding transcriptional regulator
LVIRLYGYTFVSMKAEKRIQRAYKIRKSVYDKAQKKAAKSGKTLAERIEEFVERYVAASDKKLVSDNG